MRYIIGVDAGGKKTEACAYDVCSNQFLVSATNSFGNVLVDYDLAMTHILEAILTCQAKVEGNLLGICLGIAGIESSPYRFQLEEELVKKFALPVKIVNDARLAHAAYFKGQNGILTIAGAVSFGVRDGNSAMTGGWGHLIGDEGSGYWIAMQAVRQMVQDFDENRALSKLSQKILDFYGLKEVSQIKKIVYSGTKKDLAALVPIISQEEEAQIILAAAGSYLSKMTLNLSHKLEFSEQVSVAIKGGILLKIPQVEQSFKKNLQSKIPKVKIIDKEISSTLGAQYLLKDVL